MRRKKGEKKIYKAIIEGRLWGINDMIKQAERSQYAYDNIRDKQIEKIGWALVSPNPPHIKRVGMKIAWYERDMRRNKDNIVGGGLKLILDAMQDSMIIKNDGWKEISDNIDPWNFFVDKENPRIEVEFWEEG